MNQKGHRCSWAAAWACAALLTLSAAGRAQDRVDSLPSGVTGTNEAFDAAQSDAVNRYIRGWADRLLVPDDPEAVAEARAKLLEPLNLPGATGSFKDQYSAELITGIRAGATSESLAVRLNTMILIARSTGAYGLDLAGGALRDASPAVRYWAARAVADAIDGGPNQPSVSRAEQRQLHQRLSAAVAAESTCEIREQLYRALAAMQIPAARQTVSEALMERTDFYARRGVGACLRAEKTGMNKLYSRIISEYVQVQDDPRRADRARALRQQLRRLSIIAYRYVALVGRAMRGESMSDDARVIAREVVTSAQVILTEALSAFDAGEQAGPNLNDAYNEGELVQFAWAINEWKPALRKALDIPKDELELPAPDEAAGGADGQAQPAGDDVATDGN